MNSQIILGDNLAVLKELPSESIDLIYIDPPFFSNRTYEVICGDNGEIASFNDRWAGGINHYIGWLYDRVEELYRVLKSTGSFYLHCDWHANAYIRVNILDKIFGDKNFVNEIVWCYSGPTTTKLQKFPRKHDTIFMYSKGDKFLFNKDAIRVPYKSGIHHSKHANVASFKGERIFTFEEVKERESLGKIPEDWWSDIYTVDRVRKERIGYPTQKPEALLERIIKASSNEGNIVLDAFCGGGTTCAVARRLGRKFIGIDQSVRAIELTAKRLSSNDYDIIFYNSEKLSNE